MHCELSNCEPEETLPPFTGFYQKFYLNDKKGSDMAALTLLSSAYVLFFLPVPSSTFPLSLGILNFRELPSQITRYMATRNKGIFSFMILKDGGLVKDVLWEPEEKPSILPPQPHS